MMQSDCIKNMYMSQRTDDVNAVFNAAFIKNESKKKMKTLLLLP